MADGTYGGYSSEGYGGYGYGGGYGGESGGYGYGSDSPWGDASVNIGGLNIDPYSGQDYNPAWGSVIGTLLGGPLGGLLGNLGVRGYNAISGTTTPRDAVIAGWNNGYGVAPSAYGGTNPAGGQGGSSLTGNPWSGDWMGGAGSAPDITGMLAYNQQMNDWYNQSQLWGFRGDNPAPVYTGPTAAPKPSAVSMIVNQTMPWIDRDAAGNITGSYRWKQREGQEKLTW